jgi:hypothetical protein
LKLSLACFLFSQVSIQNASVIISKTLINIPAIAFHILITLVATSLQKSTIEDILFCKKSFILHIIPFNEPQILSHIFAHAISTLSTKLLHIPERVFDCFCILQANFSFNPVSIAFIAVLESIP